MPASQSLLYEGGSHHVNFEFVLRLQPNKRLHQSRSVEPTRPTTGPTGGNSSLRDSDLAKGIVAALISDTLNEDPQSRDEALIAWLRIDPSSGRRIHSSVVLETAILRR
jgi:hypothetical protein